MKDKKLISGILLGALSVLLLFLLLRKCTKASQPEINNDYYIITNQITKMNKMVVMEQDFSTLTRTKIAYKILGSQISENEITAFTKTKAQVSYDLNKMKLEVDSTNRKLIIKALPEADIKINPSVEIQGMDDSFLNRIDENQIKQVTKSAKDDAYKRVDQQKLKNEGKKQLLQNLNQIFVLAKALKFEIVDETKTIDLQNL